MTLQSGVWVSLGLWGGILYSVWADGGTLVKISGTVIRPPPCTINNNQPIDVSFGDAVARDKLDGVNYRRTIDYRIDCQGTPSGQLRMMMKGEISPRDVNFLKSTVAGLSIRLTSNDNLLPLNQWIQVDYTHPPVLQAAPIKEGNTTLPTGEFSAIASLLISYE